MNKSILSVIATSLLAVAVLSSCGSKYNKLKFDDPNSENKEVYGDVGGEPLTVATPSKADPSVAEISKEGTPKFREAVEASVQK